MKPNNFSNFKTVLGKKGAGSSVAKKPGGAGSSVARKPGRPAKREHTVGNGVVALDEPATLQALVDRVGTKGVVAAVELLGVTRWEAADRPTLLGSHH